MGKRQSGAKSAKCSKSISNRSCSRRCCSTYEALTPGAKTRATTAAACAAGCCNKTTSTSKSSSTRRASTAVSRPKIAATSSSSSTSGCKRPNCPACQRTRAGNKSYNDAENRVSESYPKQGASYRLFRTSSNVEFRLREIFGDGNCMFRAISYILYGNENRHRQLRDMVCYILTFYIYFNAIERFLLLFLIIM